MNQVITGMATFSVTGPNLSKTASVEYTLGAYRIGLVAAQNANPNFQVTWNSALAADGNSQVEVTARDYLDNIIFQDIRPITLSNFGNSAAAPLAPALTGQVPLVLSAYDKTHFPAYWQIFLDGEILPGVSGLLFSDQDGVHSNSRATTLDTTLYPNGRHEFHFALHSNDYPAPAGGSSGLDFRGMVTQNVNINNGRALMEILPNYLFVYTPVSTGVQLTCARAYTDGYRDSCSAPAYSVAPETSSPGVHVSASGLIFASQEGYGDILVADSGKIAMVHVWVRNTPGLPQFQDSGKMGTTYLPGKSLYVVAPFQLTPGLLLSDPQLTAETKRAGVNTLNQGMFQETSDITTPFATWKQNFDVAAFASSYAWSAANGFRVLGSGDDIVRRPGFEGMWISTWPSAPQAVQYAMQTFAQSGAGLAVDVIDESSLFWGSNPSPVGLIGSAHSFQSAACSGAQCSFQWPSLLGTSESLFHDALSAGRTFVLGGSSALATPPGRAATITGITGSTVNVTLPNSLAGAQTFTSATAPSLDFLWFSGLTSCPGSNNAMCNPPLANSLLTDIASWLRTASATVPISWPPLGTAPPSVQGNWMKAGGISDYASHYWDSTQQRRTYIFGMGARETQSSMLAAFLSRQSLVNINRPQLLEQSMAGIDYLKFSPSGVAAYTPPKDQLVHVGETPRAVVSGIMTAAAAGTAGVKVYKFDESFLARSNDTGTGIEVESDGGPSTGEILNWRAMGFAAATLTKSLQEFVLGQPVNSPYLGRNIVTGARLGTNGNLLFVVNTWDSSRNIPVNLSAYRTGNSVLRYRVTDTGIKLSSLGDVTTDAPTLAAGESALYLFPKTTTVTGIDTVNFQPDTAGTRAILRTNYLYSQNTAGFGDSVDCSSGCSVTVDRKLGDAFYTYAILDSSGAEQCRALPQLVPMGRSVTLATGALSRNPVCQ